MPGLGLARANAAAVQLGASIPLVAPAQVPNIGDKPANFNNNLTNYTHKDILQIIIFYNDSFGIFPGDHVETWRDKFRDFLRNI
jgi:hypothetical protein